MKSGSLYTDRGLEVLLTWKLIEVVLERSRSLQVLEVLSEALETFLNKSGGKLHSEFVFTNIGSSDLIM